MIFDQADDRTEYFGACRQQLISAARGWEEHFGVAPSITSALSEFDAAMLIGMTPEDYSVSMTGRSAVGKGHDFIHEGIRYQVKANRPSGRKGSFVTLVPKASNYDWDKLIWILYDPAYVIQEAWIWDAKPYQAAFHILTRLSPAHYRRGLQLYPSQADEGQASASSEPFSCTSVHPQQNGAPGRGPATAERAMEGTADPNPSVFFCQ